VLLPLLDAASLPPQQQPPGTQRTRSR
jgi:hypothetical protein